MAGIGENIVIRTDFAARIFFLVLFLFIAGMAYYIDTMPAAPGTLADEVIFRFQEALLGGAALYVLAFGWLQRIECTDSELTFRTPLQRRSFPFGEIEFAAYGTISSLRHNAALAHLPKVIKRFGFMTRRSGANPPVIVVKSHSMTDDAYILNAKAFGTEACRALFDKLAANGVRVDYWH